MKRYVISRGFYRRVLSHAAGRATFRNTFRFRPVWFILLCGFFFHRFCTGADGADRNGDDDGIKKCFREFHILIIYAVDKLKYLLPKPFMSILKVWILHFDNALYGSVAHAFLVYCGMALMPGCTYRLLADGILLRKFATLVSAYQKIKSL
jgi:hypothetical protein